MNTAALHTIFAMSAATAVRNNQTGAVVENIVNESSLPIWAKVIIICVAVIPLLATAYICITSERYQFDTRSKIQHAKIEYLLKRLSR